MSEKTIKDGGPAFPTEATVFEDAGGYMRSAGSAGGMSLRDWFAGQALCGHLSAETSAQRLAVLQRHGGDTDAAMADLRKLSAEIAYEYADAMLAARKQELLPDCVLCEEGGSAPSSTSEEGAQP